MHQTLKLTNKKKEKQRNQSLVGLAPEPVFVDDWEKKTKKLINSATYFLDSANLGAKKKLVQ